MTRDKVLMSSFPETVTSISSCYYDESTISGLASDGPEHGFTYIMIPGHSLILQEFSKNVQNYQGIFNRPLMGWVSGVALDDQATASPKVVDGRTGEWSSQRAIALHAGLEARVVAEIGIVNPFTQGLGDVITVDQAGFTFGDAYVNGAPVNLARYVHEREINTRLPLVADRLGAMVNVAFRSVDMERLETVFYAPLFPGIDYKVAAPVADYEETFTAAMNAIGGQPTVAVSCILNYIHGYASAQMSGPIYGPLTFGEIAYGLLNQTLVYMALRTT